MTKRVLVDTGPLVALYRKTDQFHAAAVAQFGDLSPPLLTCWPVIVEAAYLLRDDPKAVSQLLESFGIGLLRLLSIEQEEFDELRNILQQYRSLGAQLADVALVYLAQREKIEVVFTFDRRDFSVYRPGGKRSFTIVP
ncbi:MAG TPA: PIN domain-containing protein [Pirellulales bacterium]